MNRYQALRFWVLFVALLGFLMFWPLANELFSSGIQPNLLRDILLLSCILAVSNRVGIAIVVTILTFALVISRWLFNYGFGMTSISFEHCVAFLILLIVAGTILIEVLRAREITSQLIVGAVCVYLALAGVWAYLYIGIEAIAPGAILMPSGSFPGSATLPPPDAEIIKMLYVSLASISTLGNAQVPVTFLAHQLAAIEAITGQLYLAVLIARLVGFSIASSPRYKV